jgi:hypothetical protein
MSKISAFLPSYDVQIQRDGDKTIALEFSVVQHSYRHPGPVVLSLSLRHHGKKQSTEHEACDDSISVVVIGEDRVSKSC